MSRGDAIPVAAPGDGDRMLRSSSVDTLASTRFRDVRWVAETGSTNHDAMELARQGEHEGIVCVADHQTRGRGRRDRSWEAAPGSALLVSVLLRPPARVAPIVTLAAGVAAVDAVLAVSGVEAHLKWPNDLVIAVPPVEDARGGPGRGGSASPLTTDGPAASAGAAGPADAKLAGPVDRKLAGILAEADWPAGSGAGEGWAPPEPTEPVTVVFGIGLNVRWLPEPPPELAAGAVSLEELCGHRVDREELLVALLVALERNYAVLIDGDRAAVLTAWRERTSTLGRRVRVDLGHRDIEGTATDITETGNLVVETADGERHVLAVGDVVHLRGTA